MPSLQYTDIRHASGQWAWLDSIYWFQIQSLLDQVSLYMVALDVQPKNET